MRIAFIGLGRMGFPMARNLWRNGHEVIAYNRSPEKARTLEAEGATTAVSVCKACRDAEVCWTMLPDDAAIEDVLYMQNLISCLPEHSTHISSSTITVKMSRRLAHAHSAQGHGYLAAPVFGRPDAAEAKKLIVVAAGDESLIERHRPLFDAIGRAVFVAGVEPWQANLFKLCGNFTLAAMMEALGEAFAAIRKSGADHQTFLKIISELYGSPVYANYGGAIANSKFEPAGFALPLGLKDVRQVLEAAGELECPMPLASVIRDQFLSAMAAGQQNLDWSSVALTSARNAGLS